jgi:putative ABC transport system permease protein
VLASRVVERRREIGIRLAVGAKRLDVYRLILTKGLSTTLIGLGLGALGAAGLGGFLERFLFGVRASDPRTYLVAGRPFVTAATIACMLPARRAARVDPLESLRARYDEQLADCRASMVRPRISLPPQ